MSLFKRVEKRRAWLRRVLPAWFRRSARDLPWRKIEDPYAIWLSEVLLQQTRVETVIPYFKRMLRAFPTVQDLAAAHEDQVLKLWEGLGYYSRALSLRKSARRIVREYRGLFPRTASQWQQLPGVGRYTASAISSIAFGEPVPVLDGNVKRLLARLFAIRASIDDPKIVKRLWSVAEILVPSREPGDFNQALMEAGARICTPKGPRCNACPLSEKCDAHNLNLERSLPLRGKKRLLPCYEIVAAAIRRNGRYLLGKRPPGGLLGGLWEFPGGKVQPGETHMQALARELREELGIRARINELVASVPHAYTHFKITLHLYRAALLSGRVQARFHREIKWVFPSQFYRYAFPGAVRKILQRIEVEDGKKGSRSKLPIDTKRAP